MQSFPHLRLVINTACLLEALKEYRFVLSIIGRLDLAENHQNHRCPTEMFIRVRSDENPYG